MIGATYLLWNLFSFSQLIALYYFLPIKHVLKPYRDVFSEIVKILLYVGDINNLIQVIFGKNISFQIESEVEEKIHPSPNSQEGLYEHGFSSEFIRNSWDELLNLSLFLIKMILLRLIFLIPIEKLRKLKREWKNK